MTVASAPNDHTTSASPFSGQTVVFTGKLGSVGRREARALVERLGGLAADEVTARTTMLVIGAEGLSRPHHLSGESPRSETLVEEKSRKLKRAEAVNARTPGRIQVLSEEEFCRLGQLTSTTDLKDRYHSLRQIRELYPLVHEGRLRHPREVGVDPEGRANQCRHLFRVFRCCRDQAGQRRAGAASVVSRCRPPEVGGA